MNFEDYMNELNQISKDYHTGNFHLDMPLSEYKARIGYVRPNHPLQENEVKLKHGNVGDLI